MNRVTAVEANGCFLACRVVLFDLDGTLVDSTEAILRAWHLWATEVAVEAEGLNDIVFGRSAADIIGVLAPSLRPEVMGHHVRRVLALQEKDPAPGTMVEGGATLLCDLGVD